MNWEPRTRVLRNWMAHGLPCWVTSGPVSLLGYVGVPVSHPDHGKEYDAVEVDVHGGLTFAEKLDDGTVFGFDVGHYGDWIALPAIVGDMPGRVPGDCSFPNGPEMVSTQCRSSDGSVPGLIGWPRNKPIKNSCQAAAPLRGLAASSPS